MSEVRIAPVLTCVGLLEGGRKQEIRKVADEGDLANLVAGLQKGNRRSKRYPQTELTKSTYQRVRERICGVGRA